MEKSVNSLRENQTNIHKAKDEHRKQIKEYNRNNHQRPSDADVKIYTYAENANNYGWVHGVVKFNKFQKK